MVIFFFINNERNSKVNLLGRDSTMISTYINLCYEKLTYSIPTLDLMRIHFQNLKRDQNDEEERKWISKDQSWNF